VTGRHGVQRLGAVLLVCAGCSGVAERPGEDFAARILDPSPIEVVSKIDASVRFAVDGCGTFDLGLEDHSGATHPLSFTSQTDGTFVAAVPVAWLEDSCTGSALPAEGEVDPGTLVAICRDADRSARAGFTIRHRQGSSVHRGQLGEIRGIFPGSEIDRPWWIATAEYGGEVDFGSGTLTGEWAPALDLGAYLNPLVRPRLARRGSSAFATLGCEAQSSCPAVAIGPGESDSGERLGELDAGAGALRAVAMVSMNVVDMDYAADGALVVVSDSSVGRGPPQYLPGGAAVDGEAARWGETVVWRVTPAPTGGQGVVEDAATVLARLPNETVVTRLARTASGALAFATLGKDTGAGVLRVNLHVTDGSTLTTSYTGSTVGLDVPGICIQQLGSTFVNAGVFLSPDAASMVFACDHVGFFWMNTDPSDRALEGFGMPSLYDPRQYDVYDPEVHGGAAWMAEGLALWRGGDLLSTIEGESGGVVQVYEVAPPHAFRFEHSVEALPGALIAPKLVGVVGVGDHLVLTTTTGFRILDASGALVGGTDPLPCGALTTAVAEQVGPTTVAIGVGPAVVSFEVAP